MQKNVPLDAKIGVDTAENEPRKLMIYRVIQQCGLRGGPQWGPARGRTKEHPRTSPPGTSPRREVRLAGIKIRLILRSPKIEKKWFIHAKKSPPPAVTTGSFRAYSFWNLSEARSRLYQRRCLQSNIHFAAFFEIYRII